MTDVRKMYVLNNGRIVMLTNNKVTNDDGGNGEAPAIPIHSFLLDTAKGYVLFDTGCDPKGMTENWPLWLRENPYEFADGGTPAQQLALIGLKPADISYVVMSHLHVDHAGTLSEFTNAEVIVSREEFVKVMRDYAEDKLDGFHVKSDVESWLKAELNWHLIPQDMEEWELCPGLKVLNFGPGHAYGMLGLEVVLEESGAFILAADTIYTADHMGPPAKMAGIAYEEEGYYATIERIRTLAARDNAKVLFGHDMEQFGTLIKAGAGFYR